MNLQVICRPHLVAGHRFFCVQIRLSTDSCKGGISLVSTVENTIVHALYDTDHCIFTSLFHLQKLVVTCSVRHLKFFMCMNSMCIVMHI